MRSIAVAGSPFGGAPATIPGTILAANFDEGGQNVAYYDTTPGNLGGAYRDTDVDIEEGSEGYDVGWIAPTEWLNYTVNVTSDGDYMVQLRVASPSGGGLLHIGFDGGNVWATVPIPATGDWQNWTNVNLPVTLTAGIQLMTLYFDTDGFNIESVTVGNGPLPAFSHVYVIVMENHELSDIIGNPDAPYINWLAEQYGLATGYTAVTHPSLPNYMALTSGDTYFSNDCVDCTVDVPNIADQIEASGRNWTAYMEDMPAACQTSDNGLYAAKHNPFVHYDDIVTDTLRCQSRVVPLTGFYSDLANGSLPDFAWITPNLCSDMHDCDVATGDGWLSMIVPQILGTPDMGNSVLFIVWDEGTTDAGGGGVVPLLVVSPLVPSGFQSSADANHFSLLHTIEEAWGLSYLGEAASARSLLEYFPGP